eukprot:365023-Chlamydomonas_euryale.AAC.1
MKRALVLSAGTRPHSLMPLSSASSRYSCSTAGGKGSGTVSGRSAVSQQHSAGQTAPARTR